MTSLSNVIKRQQATSFEPQRIDSRPLLEPVAHDFDSKHDEQELEQRFNRLRQEEEALQSYREQTEQELHIMSEQMLEAARGEGYSAGFEQGKYEGKAEFEELTTRLNAASNELETVFEEKWRAMETKLITMAIEISARITTDLVREDEELFADMIRKQLFRQIDAEALTIYVHPTRLASIQRFESQWKSDEMPPMKYRGDATLPETSVRIETPHHGNELDLDYSFDRIRSQIEEVLADGAY